MPIYLYQYLSEEGNPLDEYVEILQNMSEDALSVNPENNRRIQRIICAPSVRDSTPVWERCKEVRDHIKMTRPKYINDGKQKIKFDPKKHG
jgi:uncharacterized protein YPO0396